MTRSLFTRLPLALALCCAASACARADDVPTGPQGSAAAGSTTDLADGAGDGCRTFATSGTIAFGEASGTLSCAYDETAQELACDIEAADFTMGLRTTYASLEDFIEEGRHVGKTTSLTETQLENGRPKTTTNAYDELGRLTGSAEVRDDGQITRVFSEHDELGRPRRQVLSYTRDGGDGCEGLAAAVSYDDTLRTVSRTYLPEGGSQCGFETRTDVDRYDEVGNLVVVREGDETMFEATMVEGATLCD